MDDFMPMLLILISYKQKTQTLEIFDNGFGWINLNYNEYSRQLTFGFD